MSISSLLSTGYGSLNIAVADAQQTQGTIDQLTNETASGYISSNYSGLGSQANMALDLNTEIAGNSAVTTNINNASAQLNVTQSALSAIQSIVGSLTSQISLAETSGTSITPIADQAQAALEQVAQELDTQYGSTYVFSGDDTVNPPVPNAGGILQSNFYTAVQQTVAGLGTNGASATTAQLLTNAAPGATSPFSTTLESSNTLGSVSLGGTSSMALGVLADQNLAAVSSGVGTTSTGSYMRDIFMGLAALSSLTSSQQTLSSYNNFVSTIGTTLNNAAAGLNIDISAVGAQQQQLTSEQNQITNLNTALKTQLGNIQDANLSSVATQLSQAQTQLQASYQIISALSTLSLAKFLPA